MCAISPFANCRKRDTMDSRSMSHTIMERIIGRVPIRKLGDWRPMAYQKSEAIVLAEDSSFNVSGAITYKCLATYQWRGKAIVCMESTWDWCTLTVSKSVSLYRRISTFGTRSRMTRDSALWHWLQSNGMSNQRRHRSKRISRPRATRTDKGKRNLPKFEAGAEKEDKLMPKKVDLKL